MDARDVSGGAGLAMPGDRPPDAAGLESAGEDIVLPGLRIQESLGEGLRGSVHAATDGHRKLAVKVLRHGASLDRGILERFLRTAEDGGPPRIRHPNLVPIERIGETEDGRTYYVMPLLRGDPLDRILSDLKRGSSERPSLGPLSVGPGGETHPELVRRAAEVFADAAEGLAAAHRAGVTHRRLSPRNLIFTPAGRLVITDFGGEASTAAGDGLVYVAPEELALYPKDVGPPTDVYSLGVMLYELVSRRLPFESENPQELKRAIVKGRFPVPRSLRADVPAPLEAAILKAMAKTPADRYPDAGELAEELRRFLRHEMPLAFREARAANARGPSPRGSKPAGTDAPTAAAPSSPPEGARWRIRAPGWRGQLGDPGSALRRTAAAALLAVFTLLAWWGGRSLPHSEDRPEDRAGRLTRAISLDPGMSRPGDSRSAGTHSLAPRLSLARPVSSESRAVPGDAGAILRSLSIGEGKAPVLIDGEAFAEIHDILSRIGGDGARSLLCTWDLETMRRLDLAPRPASLAIHPNLRLELDDLSPRDFAARWVRTAARVDPTALLDLGTLSALLEEDAARGEDEPAGLARREEILRTLIGCLAALGDSHGTPADGEGPAGSGDARAAIAAIGREHWLTNGEDALRALSGIGAHDVLMELVLEDLPLPFREAAIAFLGEDAALHLPELRALAFRSPHRSLRRLAFRRLAIWSDPELPGDLARAIEDPELMDEALASLVSIPGGPRARLALDLLRHPREDVRSRAIAVLSTCSEAGDEPEVALRLLSPSRAEREGAFALLRMRTPPDQVVLALTSCLARPAR